MEPDRRPTPPPLDYATVPPPVGRPRVHVRFTAGVAAAALGFFAIAYQLQPPSPRDDVDPCCMSIGFAIELAVVAGVFRGGQAIYARRQGQPPVERGMVLTVGIGAGVTLVAAVAAAVFDQRSSHYGVGTTLVVYLILVAASPWCVFKPDGG